MPGLDLATTVLWVLVGLATVWDVAQRRIPNRLVLVGLFSGMALQAWSDGIVGLGLSALGGLAALLLLIGPFAARVLGGGDVKLAMVCGVFLGWKGAVHVVLLGTLSHGFVALLWVGGRAALRRLGRPSLEDTGIPHAVGFAIATALYTLGTVRIF